MLINFNGLVEKMKERFKNTVQNHSINCVFRW